MKKSIYLIAITSLVMLSSFIFITSQKSDSYYFKGKIGGKEFSLQDGVNEYSYNYNIAGNYHGASIQCNKYKATNISNMFLKIDYAPANEADFVKFFKKGIDTLGRRFSITYSPLETKNNYKIVNEDNALIEFTEVKDLGMTASKFNPSIKVRTIEVKGIVKKAVLRECDSKYSTTFLQTNGDTLVVENLKFYQKFSFGM